MHALTDACSNKSVLFSSRNRLRILIQNLVVDKKVVSCKIVLSIGSSIKFERLKFHIQTLEKELINLFFVDSIGLWFALLMWKVHPNHFFERTQHVRCKKEHSAKRFIGLVEHVFDMRDLRYEIVMVPQSGPLCILRSKLKACVFRVYSFFY